MPVLEPPKPKRRRKRPDYAQLITPRTGRLTPSYWLLKEGFVQDVQRERYGGTKKTGVHYNFWQGVRIGALVKKGFLEQRQGPRKGVVYRTTGEGAFAMLLAEGQFEAKRALTKS
jgi:hypothetical protein